MSGPFLLLLRIALALSLYAFIGWAFLFLWRNFKIESELLTKTKHFRNPEITLGRDPHCDIYLENETVSAHHTRLSYHHGQWWMEDLQSTNGTTLNGEDVETPTIVIGGDEIRCGDAPIKVRLGVSDLSPNTQKI